VIAEDHLTAEDRAERRSYVGCIAGALSKGEYEAGLAAAGFDQVSLAFTHQVGDGLHSAIIKATKPTTGGQPTRATTVAGRDTLPIASQPGCC
jgi:arsenite methyltransferase